MEGRKPVYKRIKKLLTKRIPEIVMMMLMMIASLVTLMVVLDVSSGNRELVYVMFAMPIYDKIATHDSIREPEVIRISDFCSPFEREEQVECVMKQIRYDYELRDEIGIKTLSEMQNDTGICRDIAVAQVAIFKRLNYTTYFRFLKSHVYVTIHRENMYCDIDALQYNCKYFD